MKHVNVASFFWFIFGFRFLVWFGWFGGMDLSWNYLFSLNRFGRCTFVVRHHVCVFPLGLCVCHSVLDHYIMSTYCVVLSLSAYCFSVHTLESVSLSLSLSEWASERLKRKWLNIVLWFGCCCACSSFAVSSAFFVSLLLVAFDAANLYVRHGWLTTLSSIAKDAFRVFT